ncbi:hypothetical protein [Methylobacterium oryzisoli]|uniref:hypothetical protein n=1 Tax=Methylobacterium oryzisoli TaxID=3385502 RepID=UPI0038920E7A
MDEDQKLAATEACRDILNAATETLLSARCAYPVITAQQSERAALQTALGILVSLYAYDPTAVGGSEGAIWILDRILTLMGEPVERATRTHVAWYREWRWDTEPPDRLVPDIFRIYSVGTSLMQRAPKTRADILEMIIGRVHMIPGGEHVIGIRFQHAERYDKQLSFSINVKPGSEEARFAVMTICAAIRIFSQIYDVRNYAVH